MDRGAWRATTQRVARVRHNLMTKEQQQHVPSNWGLHAPLTAPFPAQEFFSSWGVRVTEVS